MLVLDEESEYGRKLFNPNRFFWGWRFVNVFLVVSSAQICWREKDGQCGSMERAVAECDAKP